MAISLANDLEWDSGSYNQAAGFNGSPNRGLVDSLVAKLVELGCQINGFLPVTLPNSQHDTPEDKYDTLYIYHFLGSHKAFYVATDQDRDYVIRAGFVVNKSPEGPGRGGNLKTIELRGDERGSLIATIKVPRSN